MFLKVKSDGKPELTLSQGSVESFERKKAKVDQLFEAVKHSVENAGQRAFKYTHQKEERINEVSMVMSFLGCKKTNSEIKDSNNFQLSSVHMRIIKCLVHEKC